MKRYLLFFFLSVFTLALAPACSKKSGCPANESLKPQMSRKGTYKKTKTQSGVFPKKMQKKMGH